MSELHNFGTTRLDGLPEQVRIWEVGPRDGLQNEKAILPVEVKAEFVERLAEAGNTVVETTSLVNPQWVPQLADAVGHWSACRPGPGCALMEHTAKDGSSKILQESTLPCTGFGLVNQR